jgi:hypothetical protein
MNNFIFIDLLFSNYRCTCAYWMREGVRSQMSQGLMDEGCQCPYTNDHTLLKGSYLCNWTFCDVVTIVTTFLNTPP